MAGDWVESPIEKAVAQKRIVFEISSNYTPISMNDPSRIVIDKLIGLCFSGPEYLSHKEAARYIVLLNELKEFNYTSWRRVNRVQMRVADLPIQELGMAVVDWVNSYFRDKHCPLLPAYALDTAMFIQAHAFGHYQHEPELWEIKPFVESAKHDIFFRCLDANFKSRFTSSFGGTLARCKVPQDCAIKFQHHVLVGGNEEFCALIKRCHLSINFQDAIYLESDISPESGYHLDLGFSFVGEIVLIGCNSLYQWSRDPLNYPLRPALFPECGQPSHDFGRLDVKFPASWVISAAHGYGKEMQFTPVPSWDAEVGAS